MPIKPSVMDEAMRLQKKHDELWGMGNRTQQEDAELKRVAARLKELGQDPEKFGGPE